jgi:type 1 fimbriae regulatory protein FimB/type 1 fimbriae regulatory protein FimE
VEKSHLALVAPTTVNGTVANRRPPRRRSNAEVRAREYLTNTEVEQLIKAAGDNRHGHRDATMILLAYRHGLRVSELVGLRWDQIDFAHGRIHINRAKALVGELESASVPQHVRVHGKTEPGRGT